MAASPRDPLAGVDRLVVDGTNLLHRLGRGGAAPPAAAIGRIRAAIPAAVRIDLVFDGPPGSRSTGPRVAQGMTVRYAGRRPADLMIAEDVEAAAIAGPAAADRILVVTDDLALRRVVQGTGARTADTRWLMGRRDRTTLASATGAAPGNRRPPAPPPAGSPAAGPSADGDGEPPLRRWRPGRGATRKVGNPRRRRPGR